MSETVSRRAALMRLGILLNGLFLAVLAIPVVGYLFAALSGKRKYTAWVTLGPLEQFPIGHVRLASFQNPIRRPWDGMAADIPCWVRCTGENSFEVFCINCTHLGCPVRWFPQSKLYMCPCHGGVYYANGDRAAGPPPRGLYKYAHKIEKGQLFIKAGELPTLSTFQAMAPAENNS